MPRGNGRQSYSVISGLLAVGIAVGLVIGYTLWGLRAPRPEVSGPQEAVDTSTAEPPEGSAEEPPPPAPIEHDAEAEQLARLQDEIDIWPARHLFISIKGKQLDPETKVFLKRLKPGGIVLLADNIQNEKQTAGLAAEIKQAVGLGTGIADLPLIAVDQEGGPVNRLNLDDAPSARTVGEKGDVQAALTMGERTAEACKARGIGIVLGPVLDVFEPGSSAGMQERCYGTDGRVVAAMGLAFADGLMRTGVLPVVKHFPGHGATREDSHTELAVLAQDKEVISKAIRPFNEAVIVGIPAMMVGHIAVPMFDRDQPKRPASLSPILVTSLLRDRFDYQGVVITDDLAMGAIAQSYSPEPAAVEALMAGNDAILFLDRDPTRIRSVCTAIERAVESGRIDRAQLLDSMSRLDQLQAWLRKPQPLKHPLPTLPLATPAASVEPGEQPTEILHIVKEGEYMSRIAVKYGVTVADIVAWNDLKDDVSRIGQKLIIKVATPPSEGPAEPASAVPRPAQSAPEPAPTAFNETGLSPAASSGEAEADPGASTSLSADGNVLGEAPAEADPSAAKPEEASAPGPESSEAAEPAVPAEEPRSPEAGEMEPAPAPPPSSAQEFIRYKVQQGDTVRSISRQFNVPYQQILEANKMKASDTLFWGRTILVPKPESDASSE